MRCLQLVCFVVLALSIEAPVPGFQGGLGKSLSEGGAESHFRMNFSDSVLPK